MDLPVSTRAFIVLNAFMTNGAFGLGDFFDNFDGDLLFFWPIDKPYFVAGSVISRGRFPTEIRLADAGIANFLEDNDVRRSSVSQPDINLGTLFNMILLLSMEVIEGLDCGSL